MNNIIIFFFKFLILFPVLIFTQNTSKDSLLEIYKKDIKNAAVLIKIGEVYAEEKNWSEAIYYYKKLVDISPNNSDYLYRLGGTQAAYSEVVSKFRVLPIINAAKRNLIKSALIDAEHIYSRWALVQIFTELPNILGGNKTAALEYTSEIFNISKIHGLLSHYYIYNFQNEEILKKEIERKIFNEIQLNSVLFEFNYFNFIVGKILASEDTQQFNLALKYFNKYLSNYSSADRFSLEEVYYYLAYCNYNIGNYDSIILLQKSKKIALQSQKKNYNLILKIEELNKLMN